METQLPKMPENFGIPTPPALDIMDGKNPFFPLNGHHLANGTEASPQEPMTPPSPERRSSRPRYTISDNSMLPMLLPLIAKAHNIKTPNSYDSLSITSSNSSDAASATSVTSATSSSNSSSSLSKSKRKRKGTPYRSPNRGDFEHDPGIVFRFPVIFSDKSAPPTPAITVSGESDSASSGSDPMSIDVPSNDSAKDFPVTPLSATIIHRPVLLPDVVRSITQSRKSRIRSRPLTRAKNRKEGEISLYEYGLTRLDLLDAASQTSSSSGGQNKQVDDATQRRSAVSAQAPSSGKFLVPPSRSSHTVRSAMNINQPSYKSSVGRSSTANSSPSFFFGSSKRRDSSVSSLSSISSDLSDPEDINTDNYGDDEDDPDFTPRAKAIKIGTGSGLGIAVAPTASYTRERKDSSHRMKICASCRTKSTPCWRPGWRPDLFLCNSCGLRFKKTRCVCPNPECRYIPLKSEYNAMFKKPKNGEIPEPKKCCKCQAVI